MNAWKDMKNGDQDAFLAIYKEHYQFLFSYGYSLCANKDLLKDALHDLFLELWNSRSSLADVDNVRAYLATWLRRKISRALALANKRNNADNAPELTQNSYEDLLISLEEDDQVKQRIASALQSLSKQQLLVIKMRYFESNSYDLIASTLGLSVRTVYNTVFAAVAKLRDAYKKS